MAMLVLVRHGESLWNSENRFTGWVDIDLSSKGQEEARQCGAILKQHSLHFDISYTSVLKRALKTHWLALEEAEQLWLPVIRSWRLNERHYGALQGLNKAETAIQHGEEQVKIWRRSFDVPPPPLPVEKRLESQDARYRDLSPNDIPNGESLKQTIERIVPFWNQELRPRLEQGQSLLVVAHGNSLRAIIQMIENLEPQALLELNVPTAIPLQYQFDKELKSFTKTYLGDPAEIAARLQQVANQGKAK